MRPVSIVRFERLYLLAMLVGMVGTALSWSAMQAMRGVDPRISATTWNWTVIATIVITYAFSLLLLYLTARRRSNIARMIVAVLFGLGLVQTLWALATGAFPMTLLSAVSMTGFVLQAAAIYFVFRPDANAWFDRRGDDVTAATFE